MIAPPSAGIGQWQGTVQDFLVDRADLRRTMVRSTAVTCDAGEAVIAVERFALTANNITYALLGDSTNYWDFFPADGKWGRIPVWGFGRVVSPGASALAADETLFGYLPMSTHLLMAPGKIGPLGLYDLVEHRAHLSPVYNYYARASANPAFDPAWEAEDMLLRPIFYASFLVHDFLSEGALAEAESVIVTSASSKTAIGLGHCLSAAGGRQYDIVGATSERNRAFVAGLGIFDRVHAYADLDKLDFGRSIVVDLSGNTEMIGRLVAQLAERMILCCLVGYTHWDKQALRAVDDRPFVRFFVPTRMRQRVQEWGRGEFDRRYETALRSFREFSRKWLQVSERAGADAVSDVYQLVVQNRVRPEQGYIVSLL